MPIITSIIAAATGASVSQEFDISTSHQTSVRVNTNALAGGETIIIQYKDLNGTWLPFTFMSDAGVAVTAQLTASINAFLITHAGTYRAVKALTASAVGVEIIA